MQKFILLWVLLLGILSCNPYSVEVTQSLDASGPNRACLEKVLDHFRQSKNVLGYRSAIFLISSMGGLLSSTESSMHYDVQTIRSSFLISQIEMACNVYQKDSGAHEIPFETFAEYVLPYRLGTEPLTDWRRACIDTFTPKYNAFSNIGNIETRHVNFIKDFNLRLMRQGYFFDNSSKYKKWRTWAELIRIRKGNCWNMASTMVYPLRALGIPVAIDFVSHWGNVDGGDHAWNVYIKGRTKGIPFLAYEGQPGTYDPLRIFDDIRRNPAKVYRKTFRSAKDRLAASLYVPGSLRIDQGIDVTEQYTAVKDVKLKLGLRTSHKMAFLSIFSNGNLEAVVGGSLENRLCTFKKMAEGVVYVPCSYGHKTGLSPISIPFAFKATKLKVFPINTGKKVSMKIEALRSTESEALAQFGLDITEDKFKANMKAVTEGRKRARPVDGKTYKLFVWDRGWVEFLEKLKEENKKIIFENVPTGTIYKLVEKESGRSHRIFSYENESQIWW
jgi:hypothetical protein